LEFVMAGASGSGDETGLGATGGLPLGGGHDASNPDGLEFADNYSKYMILGGGISGLSAASHLASRGVSQFKLLEARNRLGGRIMTFQIGQTRTELGANWIHGVLGNPLYELAVQNGLLKSVPDQKPQNVVATTEDGKRLPFNILQEVYEAYFWFFKRCEEYFICKYDPPEGVKTVGDHIELEVNIYLQKFAPGQRRARRLVFDYLMRRECCITGCHDLKEADLLSIGSYTELPGGNVTLPTGYASILAPIIKTIPTDNILKGKEVKHIYWKYRVDLENMKNDRGYESDGAESDSSVKTVRSNKSVASNASAASAAARSETSSCAPSVCATPRAERAHPNVKVELANGEEMYTDHVICTLPLGWLKTKKDLFVPELPQAKQEAMHKLIFGTVDKIFLEFERPFLAPILTEVILLWDKLPNEESLPMKERWFRKIYSFSKVSDTVLLGWISGREAEYMETLKMNVVADVCTNILRKFLADPYVPKPKSCIFTAWHSQPYSMGSYTSLGLGGQPLDIEKVAEPLFQKPNNRTPVVAFAGEHCHPSFYSTVHGAHLSGKSAAQYFLNVAATEAKDPRNAEEVFNLGAASIADLSTWLEEVSLGEKSIDSYRRANSNNRKDDGKFVTPR